MSYAVKRRAVLPMIFLMSTSATSFEMSQDPQMLVHVEEASTGYIDRVELSGQNISQDIRFRIRANIIDNNNTSSLFLATINNLAEQSVSINNRSFPDIDLSTVMVFVKRRPDNVMVKINVKFGPPRDGCFINDDGRNLLTILFRSNQPVEVHEISYEGCSTTVRRVS